MFCLPKTAWPPTCADEGRGVAAKSVGESRAGCDPTMSEWGNPARVKRATVRHGRREPGELKHLMYPEEARAAP